MYERFVLEIFGEKEEKLELYKLGISIIRPTLNIPKIEIRKPKLGSFFHACDCD